MADPNAVGAEELLKNPQFLEMFQKALGEGKIPDEKDPNRDKWLKEMQDKLHQESMKDVQKDLEKPQRDEDGEWMWIVPEPGFCIKCTTHEGIKVFINICKHPKIAEPMPMEEEIEGHEDAVKYRIPLSCGSTRMDMDKGGKPCKVYDVAVNPVTIQRCSDDNEFRRFVAALCMTWIKQKSEKNLNDEEFKNLNFKCKGKPDLQRIRLKRPNEVGKSNALNDELELPKTKDGATAPTVVAGRGEGKKMVEEVSVGERKEEEEEGEKRKKIVKAKPSYEIQEEGSYDWSEHEKPARNPYFRGKVPQLYQLQCFIPNIQSIKEVEVDVKKKSVELTYVDEDDGSPFMVIALGYPVAPDPVKAKFVKAKTLLHLTLAVELPDEVDAEKNRTEPSRDACEEEEEEKRKIKEKNEAAMKEHREKVDRIQKGEEDIMKQRKELVEGLNAMQEGLIPPALREELDKMGKEDQQVMLHRLEGKVKKGDSVDGLLEKLPSEALDAITAHIRNNLGLEPIAKKPKPATEPPKKKVEPKEISEEQKESDMVVEYNFAKKSEQYFGVKLYNRFFVFWKELLDPERKSLIEKIKVKRGRCFSMRKTLRLNVHLITGLIPNAAPRLPRILTPEQVQGALKALEEAAPVLAVSHAPLAEGLKYLQETTGVSKSMKYFADSQMAFRQELLRVDVKEPLRRLLLHEALMASGFYERAVDNRGAHMAPLQFVLDHYKFDMRRDRMLTKAVHSVVLDSKTRSQDADKALENLLLLERRLFGQNRMKIGYSKNQHLVLGVPCSEIQTGEKIQSIMEIPAIKEFGNFMMKQETTEFKHGKKMDRHLFYSVTPGVEAEAPFDHNPVDAEQIKFELKYVLPPEPLTFWEWLKIKMLEIWVIIFAAWLMFWAVDEEIITFLSLFVAKYFQTKQRQREAEITGGKIYVATAKL